MDRHYCDECAMKHDSCPKCGAAIVASLVLHRFMDAHRSSPHCCGAENKNYQARLAAMRNDYDESRDMLTECPTCRDDVIRRANSPVLYDVHGYYGLQGDTAVHQCLAAKLPEPPRQPSYKEAASEPTPIRPWRIIP